MRWTGFVPKWISNLFLKAEVGQSTPIVSIKTAQGQTGNVLEVNTTTGTGGNLCKLDSTGILKLFPTAAVNGNGVLVDASVGGGIAHITSTGSNRIMFDGVLGSGSSSVGWQVDGNGHITPTSTAFALLVSDVSLYRVSAGRMQIGTSGATGTGDFTAGNITGTTFTGNGSAITHLTGSVGVVYDGGGAPITSSGTTIYRQVPADATILSYTILGDQSGSITVTLKRSTYAGFPTTSDLTGGHNIVLSSAQKNTDSTLTGWTTSLTAGDVLEFAVSGTPTSVTRVTVILKVA